MLKFAYARRYTTARALLIVEIYLFLLLFASFSACVLNISSVVWYRRCATISICEEQEVDVTHLERLVPLP